MTRGRRRQAVAALAVVLSAVATIALAESRPHIVLISLDTLRADHLSVYGYDRATSPLLDAFAREAVVFEDAYSQSNRTAASHMTLMTGLYPQVHGVRNPGSDRVRVRLSDDIPTLAETLAAAGYSTHGLHGGGNVSASYGFGRGFESYVRVRGVAEMLDSARQRVERHEGGSAGPIFLFLHTYEIHAPYFPPHSHAERFIDDDYSGSLVSSREELAERIRDQREESTRHGRPLQIFWDSVDKDDPDDVARLRDLYDGGIHQTDDAVGRFLEWLSKRPLWQRTLVVVLADHGEEFMDHGRLAHSSLHREVVRVPLIMRFPGPAPAHRGRRIPGVARLIDVAPTLLDFAGLPVPTHTQGRSLLPLVREEAIGEPVVWSQVGRDGYSALRMGDWKLIESKEGDRLYRVSDDPGELRDLSNVAPEPLADLKRELERLQRESNQLRYRFEPEGRGSLDPHTEKQLEALGYLSPEP